jgi:microcystin-dependent protein
MADFNGWLVTTSFTLVPQRVKEMINSAVRWFDGTTDTNIPEGAKRYNSSLNKIQQWNGNAWVNVGLQTIIDNHIADQQIHAVIPPGTVVQSAATTIPTGWLLCNGAAVSRGTYQGLFDAIGTAYGAGNGITGPTGTFNLPNTSGRVPIGSGGTPVVEGGHGSSINLTRGAIGGSFGHFHDLPPHSHNVPSHTHSIDHGHTIPESTQAVSEHQHGISGHSHAANPLDQAVFAPGVAPQNRSTIHTTAPFDGSRGTRIHNHNLTAMLNGTPGPIRIAGTARPGGGFDTGVIALLIGDERVGTPTVVAPIRTDVDFSSRFADHYHDNTCFAGYIGNNIANGDQGFLSDPAGASVTIAEATIPTTTTLVSGSPTYTDTGNPSTTITGGTGNHPTNSRNQAYLCFNFIIKT